MCLDIIYLYYIYIYLIKLCEFIKKKVDNKINVKIVLFLFYFIKEVCV